ncbi:unnamed protein product [Phytophthora lilii]|uniref:Unnamed protein product n=1 Tax=Phytophthora lilii TaxID=2077276 RepID=A0A9W6U032_9STRA|nr:unnamed protein product [Phytophthora lilii]
MGSSARTPWPIPYKRYEQLLTMAEGVPRIMGDLKDYLNRSGIKHEKTVPYTPQQNGLAERMNRSLVEMARCMLYHENVEKKWWAKAVNTAAWIINRIPHSVTVKTPYEIVYKTKPQLMNLKVFGAIGYAHIPDEKRRKVDAKAFKCRFLGYKDGVKGYCVLELSTGKVKVVRTVKFMETTNPAHLRLNWTWRMKSQWTHNRLENRHMERAVVPNGLTHSMITRSRSRHIDETTDPEEAGARKKQVIDAPSSSGTKRQMMTQERNKPTGDLLAIEGGQAMAAMEGVPKSYEEVTTSADRDEWKKAIASELESLIANKTWKLVPRPAHQRPIETNSPVAYLNSIRAKLAKCCADGMHIEQCDVDTAFLYGKLEEEIYIELPEGLQELMTLAEVEGEGDVVCLVLQSLLASSKRLVCGTRLLTSTSRAWDSRLQTLTRALELQRSSRLRTSDRHATFLESKSTTTWRAIYSGLVSKRTQESIIKKFGQENAKPSLIPIDPSVHLTKADEAQTSDEKAKMKSRPYRSLVGSLMYLACGTRPDISAALAKLSRFLENSGEKHWDAGINVVRYLLKPKDMGITYGQLGRQLVAYSEADWAGKGDERGLVSGVMLLLCGAPVMWCSTFQKTVTLSSTEAEYMALSDCVKECVWMRLLLKDIGAEQVGATGYLRRQSRRNGVG